jgi:RHS repeat-associated protein
VVKILITIVQNKDGSVKETWDYVNGVEYKNRQLQRVAHSEGAVVQNEHGQYQHEYALRDHLGNTRVTFTDGVNKGEPYWDWSNYSYIQPDNTGYDDGVVTEADIKHINHTYPFGMAMEGNWNNAGSANNNRYLYNGKQWNDDFGMGWYDYGARFYDPAIARWSAVDPLTEQMRRWSAYNYAFNNPIRFVDPDGMAPDTAALPNGATIKGGPPGTNLVAKTNEVIKQNNLGATDIEDTSVDNYMDKASTTNDGIAGGVKTSIPGTGFIEDKATIKTEVVIASITSGDPHKPHTESTNVNQTATVEQGATTTTTLGGSGKITDKKNKGNTASATASRDQTTSNNSTTVTETSGAQVNRMHKYSVSGYIRISVTQKMTGGKVKTYSTQAPFSGEMHSTQHYRNGNFTGKPYIPQ